MYVFQPQLIDVSTGLPVEGYWVNEARITPREFVEKDLPLEILYKGGVIFLDFHMSDWIHFEAKSK